MPSGLTRRTSVATSALRVAARLTVGHIHLSAAMAASEQARENEFALPRRPARDGAAFSGSVVRNHTLVPFELLPTDIALVLIFEQHVPFRAGAPKSASHTLSPVLDDDLARRAPKGVGASIDRIGEDVVHRVV